MPTVPKTFYSLQAIGRMLNIPADTIKDAYRGRSLNSIQAIAPIAHLFQKFEEGDEFSYAILKKHFDKWQKTGKVPKVSTGRPAKWKNTFKCIDCGKIFNIDTKDKKFQAVCTHCGSDNINRYYDNINIPIPKDLYDRFKRMVDNANSVSAVKVSYRDMIYVAMEECMQRRPQFLGGVDNASKQKVQ